jgi:AcrR family transcriptional regulator
MRKRADRVAETRRRITEAAVELHGTVGPAQTTISAIAERAGVERLTVYRHFPDEAALFQACSGLWFERHPLPAISDWTHLRPAERLRRALEELYRWYRRTEPMMANVIRDAPRVPAMTAPVERRKAYLNAAVDVLARGWGARGRRRRLLRAAIDHSLDFDAWRSLTSRGLTDEEAAELMVSLVTAVAPPGAASRSG